MTDKTKLEQLEHNTMRCDICGWIAYDGELSDIEEEVVCNDCAPEYRRVNGQ